MKANAYGHGLEICAPAVVRAGARWLGVTSVEEGVAARAVCPDAEILVISGVFRGQGSDAVENRLTVVAWEPWHLDELGSAGAEAGQIPVHLEIDTGMSRQGAGPDALGPLLARFGDGSPLKLDGVMTHLFAADEADGAVTQDQLARLEVALSHVKAAGLKPAWLNVGNSAALLGGQAEALGALAARFGMKAMLRPGLALYGLAPEFDPEFEGGEPASLVAAHRRLQPVLTWKTKVVGVRDIAAGSVVGYNGTFVATEPMKLALLAAGYADGLDRKLGQSMQRAGTRATRAAGRSHQYGPGSDRRDRDRWSGSRRRSGASGRAGSGDDFGLRSCSCRRDDSVGGVYADRSAGGAGERVASRLAIRSAVLALPSVRRLKPTEKSRSFAPLTPIALCAIRAPRSPQGRRPILGDPDRPAGSQDDTAMGDGEKRTTGYLQMRGWKTGLLF